MAVDHVNLEKIRIKVRDKIRNNNTENARLSDILTNIEDIQLIQDPAFPDDKTKKIKQKDKGVGGEITAQRENSIYEKILVDKTALGL